MSHSCIRSLPALKKKFGFGLLHNPLQSSTNTIPNLYIERQKHSNNFGSLFTAAFLSPFGNPTLRFRAQCRSISILHPFILQATGELCTLPTYQLPASDTCKGTAVHLEEPHVDSDCKVTAEKTRGLYKKPVDFTKVNKNLLPTVVLVGRPNVGKSALFNRLIRRREALVYNTPDDHVTRDIREGIAKLGDLRFRVLDSAGLETAASSGSILDRTSGMTASVLARSQFAVFLLDVRAGLHPLDLEVGRWLRKNAPGINLVVAMNKSEALFDGSGSLMTAATEAYRLGFGDPIAISAETGLGMQDLYESLKPKLEDYMLQVLNNEESTAEDGSSCDVEESKLELQLAIVGRPNVGKSTLLNTLLQEERVLVGPEAGLTRDSIRAQFEFEGRTVYLSFIFLGMLFITWSCICQRLYSVSTPTLQYISKSYTIDFEKAYDHVEWRFLEEVLQRKGFGNRWRKWMQGCLSSANFSVLINGRPRGKFQASRGLRQGDPLSPFLFTLVVDVLSRLMEKAQETDLIKGLCIGQEKVEISHLQFADDTIFFLTEDEEVWNNLIQVLNLFCSVSGLKINKAKCFLAGINSDNEKLNRLAVSWGCEVGCWPIKYLGLPLGGRPRAIKFWDPVVETMERRLQSWKKAFLSRGGKLTLIQSVLGSMPIYYMSLFKIPCGVRGRIERLMKGFLWEGMEEGKKTHLAKWELVTKNKEEGGLGVGNLRNQNEALLAKWLWRFPRESQSLWHKVIKSKYGLQANGWEALPHGRVSSRSPWKDISSGSQQFLRCCTFEVGNGERVRFWEDGWVTGGPLKEQFPRLFLLSRKHNQNISSFVEVSANPLCWNFDFRRNLNEMEIVEVATLLQKLEEVRLSPLKRDIRRWNLEASGLFSCKSYRSLRSNDGSVHYFPPYPQIWKSKVPPKVKILVWLAANGNLNTCDRIQRRNPLMCLSPHWCSLCKAKEESVNHIFLHCSYSIQLWWKLFQEVKASWVIPKGCFELLSTNFKALGKRKKSKVLWGCLVSAIFWNIWLERNKRIFEDYTGVGAEELWGRVKYWAAFWASVTKEFKNVSLSQILWDVLAAVK